MESETSRTKYTVINSGVGFLSRLLQLIMGFVSRAIFLKYLGVDVLGLNSLFTNLLGYLNFAELGIGAAITFSLYQPLAEKNYKQLNAIMNLYRRWYRSIAIIVSVVGIILSFFVKDMIHGGTESLGVNIQLTFLLTVLNLSFSYLVTYKRTLLTADQHDYVNQINLVGFNIVGQILQILALVFWRSFYLFLIIQALMTFLSNIRINHVTNKRYSFLKEKTREKVPESTMAYIKKNMAGMASSKFGGIIVNSTDNLILSAFVGLQAVALYSNYLVLITGISAIVSQVISSATASIGNLNASKVDEKVKLNIFYKYFSVSAFIAILSVVGFTTFSSTFVSLWLGPKMVYTAYPLILLAFNFLLQNLRQTMINYSNAYGLYWHARWKSIFEALVNLVISLILVKVFNLGVSGVLLGTISSNIFVNFFWETYIVGKYGLNTNIFPIYRLYFGYVIVGALGIALGSYLVFNFDGIKFFNGVIFTIITMIITAFLIKIANDILYPNGLQRIDFVDKIVHFIRKKKRNI